MNKTRAEANKLFTLMKFLLSKSIRVFYRIISSLQDILYKGP